MSFDDLSHILDADKAAFLDEVEKSVRQYVIGTGKQCVAVVEKIPTSDGYVSYKHEMHMNRELREFAEVLIKFIRGKRHDGHALDSALTEPILKIIEDKYVALYNTHGEEITSEFLKMLKNDNILLDSFVSRLVDEVLGKVSKKVRAEIVHLLVDQIRDAATSKTAHIIGQHISHFASTAVGAQIASVAAHALLKAIAMNMGLIVKKFLASAAAKKVGALLMHKVMGVITTAVVNFLLIHFGSAIGVGALMWIILPIVAVILYEQIENFPKKMGDEVSKSVRSYLASNFQQTNKDIFEKIFEEIFNGEKLLEAVAEDENVKDMLRALCDKVMKDKRFKS